MCNRPSLPSPFLLDTVCTQPTLRVWKNKSQNMGDSIKLSEVFVIKVTETGLPFGPAIIIKFSKMCLKPLGKLSTYTS